jgi:hypothetical protein
MRLSQRDYARQWFLARPNRIFSSRELREQLAGDYEVSTGRAFGDPEKAVRELFKLGFLQRPFEGHYLYETDVQNSADLSSGSGDEFPEDTQIKILERDEFKCVICKRGVNEGALVSVGFAKSNLRGGRATVENGRTFCVRHKLISELSQTSMPRTANLRAVNALLPISERSGARAQMFWEELLDLLKKYGVSERDIVSEARSK